MIDAGQLEQVLLNLVLNAQSAMPEGGTLTIRTSAVEIGEEPTVVGLVPGGYVAIAVTDTGVGMNEVVRSHALEPFFTTRRDAGGSGLGLATVYGIVTGAGGSVTLESAPGEGTTVVLYLPTTSESLDVSDGDRRASTPERPGGPDRGARRRRRADDPRSDDAHALRAGIHGAVRRVRRRRHSSSPDGRSGSMSS